MIVIHSMMTYAKTASRWSRRTAPIAASARHKMDADFGDMPGAGWSNGSSPGFNGSAASLSAGSFIRRTSLASCNSLASLSSSNDFEIGSNVIKCDRGLAKTLVLRVHRARAGEIQHGPEQHRGVAVRQDEAIAIRPDRVLRIEAHDLVPDHVDQRRERHRRAGMA